MAIGILQIIILFCSAIGAIDNVSPLHAPPRIIFTPSIFKLPLFLKFKLVFH